MPRLSNYYEKQLRKIAGTDNADGYGKWLSAQSEDSTRDVNRARQSAAAEAVRSLLIDYGTSGEALARSGLADDGYSDYLRKAAKEARAARISTIESERASKEREVLSGYASYLEDVRRAEGDRLIDAAEELLAMSKPNTDKANRIIKGATDDTRARDLLWHIRNKHEYIPSDTSHSDVTSVISRIREMGYDADRAYRYCKLMGYSDDRAREIAEFATEDYRDLSEELKDLFGD